MAGKVFILGLKELKDDVKDAERDFATEVERNIRDAADMVVGLAQRNFRGSRTRALYMIRGGRRVKRKPPRPITSPPHMLGVFEGTYKRAISRDVRRNGKMVTAEIGPVGIRYARRHEFGTLGMPQRMVLTPAVEDSRERNFAMLGQSFRVLR